MFFYSIILIITFLIFFQFPKVEQGAKKLLSQLSQLSQIVLSRSENNFPTRGNFC